MRKQRSRWLTPLMSAESSSLSSSLSVLPLENFIDSFITLIGRIVLLTMLRSKVSEMERNSRRRLWKKRGSVPWKGPRNGRASSLLCPSSWPLYRISLGCTPMFPNVGAPRAHIPACDTDASRAYNFSIQLRYCTSASSALPSILLVALCSCSSTLAQSSSSERGLSEAQVRSSSYRCCCCLSLLPTPLASSSLRLLSPSSLSSSLNVYLLLRERGTCSYRDGRGLGDEVHRSPARPAFSVSRSARVLTLLRAVALRHFFERGMLAMNLCVISKSKSQMR